MQFRLVYHGPLKSSQPGKQRRRADPVTDQKHEIRRAFHEQLREVWAQTSVLKESEKTPTSFAQMIERGDHERWGADRFPEREKRYPLAELVAYAHQEFGHEWVPLARKDYRVHCELDITLLRRDGYGSALENGDLDNRTKTLIDALKKPSSINEMPNQADKPRDDERPFYVLLEDDSLVSRISVETDRLFYPKMTFPKSPRRLDERVNDDKLVYALVTVNIRGWYPSFFNMMWL